MKRIGLLGGTSWPSTANIYGMLNQEVASRLGGHHSADIILRSIDYHAIKIRYGASWDEIPPLLEEELRLTLALPIDCLILCNNTLHKGFDAIRDRLPLTIPFFHAVELTAAQARNEGMKRLLLLATRFTLEDGFFAHGLEKEGLAVTIPNAAERDEIQAIQSRLAENDIRPEHKDYFVRLFKKYADHDAAVLACTELPLAISAQTSPLRLLDPAALQVHAALDFALGR